MSIKESALTAITSIAQSDFIRAVTSAGASRRVTVTNLAKAIIESYTGSSLAGSNQSIKAALDSLNSKTISTSWGTTLTWTQVKSISFLLINANIMVLVWAPSSTDVAVLAVSQSGYYRKSGSNGTVSFGATSADTNYSITRNGDTLTLTAPGSCSLKVFT